MDIRDLRTFVAVAESKSFTRAALLLHISQPSLSRQMRDLEDELGVRLLVRTSTGVEVSSAGRALLQKSRKLLQDFDEVANSMRLLAQPTELTVACMATAFAGPLGKVLRSFESHQPGLVLTILELTPGRQLEALRLGQIDIALIGHSEPKLSPDLDVHLLGPLLMSAVVHKDHRLVSHSAIELASLSGDPFIGLQAEEFPGRHDFISAACLRAGFTLQWAAQANGIYSMLALVGQGKGVAIAPSETSTIAHPDAIFIPLLGEDPVISYCAGVAPGDQRPLVMAFLRECRSALSAARSRAARHL
jgi:DNA-binding transcriptional LysR family regulator